MELHLVKVQTKIIVLFLILFGLNGVYGQIQAVDDSFSTVLAPGEVLTENVVANDFLDGNTPVIGTDVSLTADPNGTNPSGITLDTNTGMFTVDAGTADGSYTLEYQICQISTPTNCAIASSTIIVGDVDDDGVGDTADLDDDNDGIIDADECPDSNFITNPDGSITRNGITITSTYGGVGTGANGSNSGNVNSTYPNYTAIQATPRVDSDGNGDGWEDYIYLEITFSQAVEVGDTFGMVDMGGNASGWEIGSVIGYNGTTAVVPLFTNVGSYLAKSTVAVVDVNAIPGVVLPSSLTSLNTAASTPGNIQDEDPDGQFTADFGTNLVDRVIILYGLGRENVTGGSSNQSSGTSNTGYYNIPELACDFDNDGIPNIVDLDSDNDGIPDNVEAQTSASYIAPSGTVDADGVDTAYTGGLTPENTDGTDTEDYLDSDSDNDGIDDTIEAAITLTGTDTDLDGLDDATDATADYTDVGGTIDDPIATPLPDLDADASTGGDLDFRDDTDDRLDTDGDGIVDEEDLDDDNDGILDTDECVSSSLVNIGSDNGDSIDINGITVTYLEGVVGGDGTVHPVHGDAFSGDKSISTLVLNRNGSYDNNSNGWENYTYTIVEFSQPMVIGDIFKVVDLDGASNWEMASVIGFNGSTAVLPTYTNVGALVNTQSYPVIASIPGYANFPTSLETGDSSISQPGDVDEHNSIAQFTADFGSDAVDSVIVIYALGGPAVNNNGTQRSGVEIDFSSLTAFACDSDLDGIPNNLDLDADNDGILDADEAGHDQSHTAGVVDATVGEDGIPDAVQTDPDGYTVNYVLSDFDADDIADALDLDSDSDGIPDNVEAQTSASYTAPSGTVDADGVDIAYTGGLTPENTDGTDTEDYLDSDSDNDGIDDTAEAAITLTGTDTDLDGLDDATDATADYTDVGGTIDDPIATPLPDLDADASTGGDLDFRDTSDDRIDTDGDGVTDDVDLDDDNDGILDSIECTDLDISDSVDNGNGTVTINGIVITSAYGGAGTGVVGTESGNAFTDYPNYTIIQTQPRNSADNNSGGWQDYVYLEVSFSEPVEVGDNFGMVDIDGNAIGWEMGSIIGYNGSTAVVPTFTNIGANLNQSTVAVNDVNAIPGVVLPTSLTTFDASMSTVNNAAVEDASNHFTADFGTNLLDKIILVLGIGPNVTNNRTTSQTSGISNTGFYNIPQFTCDIDNDGIPNIVDLDSDNDGIPDNVEAQTSVNYIAPSGIVDADGVDTAYTGGLTPENTDGTDTEDYLDSDSDNDGIDDTAEAAITLTGTDTDLDGLDDATDATADYTDVGGTIDDPIATPLPDLDADASTGGDLDFRDTSDDRIDTDGDGVTDDVDLDDDNDGILDSIECTDLDISDSVDNGNGTVTINGIVITSAYGGAGTGVVGTESGNAFTDYPNYTIIQTQPRNSADNNSGGWQDYVYLEVSFSEPVEVGDNFGMVDIDGNAIGWEMGSIIGYNGSTAVVPTFTNIGANLNQSTVAVNDVNAIPGVVLPTSLTTFDASMSTVNNAAVEDASNHFTADFGTNLLDKIILVLGIGPNVTNNRTTSQTSGISNTGFYNIPQFTCDIDNDGIPNIVDLDSDNDGIPDNVEAQTSVNYIAPSGIVDADGVDTAYTGGLTPENTDGTDTEDYLDSDSDNDGIDDTAEAAITLTGTDTDLDGLDDATDATADYTDVGGTIDDPIATPLPDVDADASTGGDLDFRDTIDDRIDTDGDGVTDDVDLDDDNDGILDTVEGDLDFDGDSIINSLDLDSDNDGIPDNVEAQTTVGYTPPNTDDSATYLANDGVNSAYLGGLSPTNTDGADNPDYLDLDSDNEGSNDTIEAGITLTGNDIDNDGLDDETDTTVDYSDVGGTIDNPLSGTVILPDFDNNALNGGDIDFRDVTDDFSDLDSDNDGITDSFEDLNSDGDNDPSTDPTDTDGDGFPDYLDIDADGDGIPDNVEAQATAEYNPPSGIDANTNGLDDAYEANGLTGLFPVDTDGDNLPDYLDEDSDNDNVLDAIEAHDYDHDGIADVVSIGSDKDNDGLDDGFEGESTIDIDVNDEIDDPFNDLPNTDGYLESDYRDTDDDNDGIETINEDINLDGNYANDDSNGNGIPNYLEPNLVESENELEVFNIITPNGDGVHDVLRIDGLENFPNNNIQIINRWGVLVFSTSSYNTESNNFAAVSTARATVKTENKLPVGTYFYILNYGESEDNMKSKTGYIYINR
ncbi:gliding motility-associated C-terminal domain-containing protein [Maribacter sp. Asnod1-A12]|uniref:T9SS type B sorting domain-containing protein n=1 Tax=Maribacter sp. Asnod1-A12 TaxID=3160576 RepID=UPI00386B5C68